MSALESSAFAATASQLAAALEAYENDMDRLIAPVLDPDLYQKVSQRMDEMRLYALALPRVSVAWVEVLIRHFELTHGAWRLQQGGCRWEELVELREAQRAAVHRLRAQCLRIVASPGKGSQQPA